MSYISIKILVSLIRYKYTLYVYLNIRVHSGTIHNSQEVEVTQMSIDRRMDKQNVSYPYSGILPLERKEVQNKQFFFKLGNPVLCFIVDEP